MKIAPFIEKLTLQIRSYVDKKNLELAKRIDAIEIVQKEWRYTGTHEHGRHYKAGNFCTHGGSLWHCLHDTTQTPGQGDGWQLAAKRGADGR